MEQSEGIKLITAERIRQIEKEGFDAAHDDEHGGHELAYAAICYAAPRPISLVSRGDHVIQIHDPWPFEWAECWDKRKRNRKGILVEGMLLPPKRRIRDLVKAGALIAAEIDRLIRLQNMPEEEIQ